MMNNLSIMIPTDGMNDAPTLKTFVPLKNSVLLVPVPAAMTPNGKVR